MFGPAVAVEMEGGMIEEVWVEGWDVNKLKGRIGGRWWVGCAKGWGLGVGEGVRGRESWEGDGKDIVERREKREERRKDSVMMARAKGKGNAVVGGRELPLGARGGILFYG